MFCLTFASPSVRSSSRTSTVWTRSFAAVLVAELGLTGVFAVCHRGREREDGVPVRRQLRLEAMHREIVLVEAGAGREGEVLVRLDQKARHDVGGARLKPRIAADIDD